MNRTTTQVTEPDIATLTTDWIDADENAGENWADINLESWIAEHGGTDVTDEHGVADFGTWVGDVDLNGRILRLTLDGQNNRTIAHEVLDS